MIKARKIGIYLTFTLCIIFFILFIIGYNDKNSPIKRKVIYEVGNNEILGIDFLKTTTKGSKIEFISNIMI